MRILDSHDHILIRKVWEPYGWLGNMSPHTLTLNGVGWRTAEAAFQAMRFDDPDIKEEIRLAQSPMGAKMIAKRNRTRMTIIPQGFEDLENMETILKAKLKQHPLLIDALLTTGKLTIIEDCSKRMRGSGIFWGAGLKDGEWTGHNHLGKLWMKIRDEMAAIMLSPSFIAYQEKEAELRNLWGDTSQPPTSREAALLIEMSELWEKLTLQEQTLLDDMPEA